MSYTITATHNGKTASKTLSSLTEEEATFEGMFKVLDLAYNKNNAWANGEIRLIDPNGQVLQTMPAKEEN